jgi:hypothetical protein
VLRHLAHTGVAGLSGGAGHFMLARPLHVDLSSAGAQIKIVGQPFAQPAVLKVKAHCWRAQWRSSPALLKNKRKIRLGAPSETAYRDGGMPPVIGNEIRVQKPSGIRILIFWLGATIDKC